ncbi:MAG: hypothetical protein JWM53_863, partial [bacterium]|nr:hypothetical protein [bacterium]
VDESAETTSQPLVAQFSVGEFRR